MELRQLRYFVAVAEEASFTRAAAKLHVAQPGVSAQIRQLEREFGQSLLRRTARSVRLTQVGAAVLPYARAALAAADGARHTADEHAGLLRGRVALGAIPSCGAFDVPELLAGFHQAHAGVELTLSEARSDVLYDALRTHELDVALAAFSDEPPPGIEVRVVAEEPLVAAVAPSDPLAGVGSVALAELRDRTFICLPRGPGIRGIFEQGCATAGFVPRVTFEASDPALLAELACRALGVAILPASSVAERPEDLRAVTITRPALHGYVALAWSADGPGSPAARAFLDHARKVLGR